MTKNKLVCSAWLSLIFLISACSTRVVRPNRHGLLDDSSTSSSSSVNRQTASEMYAIKPGGVINLKGDWQWPLSHVEISSSYGERGGKFHQGIDLRA
jgi:murein DD-endopeptidase MepM/ murein hydrolase activator NlpD